MASDVRSILRRVLPVFILLNLANSSPYRVEFQSSISKGYHFYSTKENNSLRNGAQGLNRDVDGEYQSRMLNAEKFRYSSSAGTGRDISFFGFVEAVFSAVANGIGNIMTSLIGPEERSRSRSARVNYRNYHVLRLHPLTDKEADDLWELRAALPEDIKFWIQPAVNKSTHMLVPPSLVPDVKAYVRERRIDFDVQITDLQKMIATQNPKMSKEQREDLVTTQGHSMTWKRYHRYGDIIRYLEHLAFRYPKMVELITIGYSYEGQPLKMAKISTGRNKDGEKKPVIWIDAGMHAREWIAPAVATYIISQLVERNTTYMKLLDNSDWMILPVANPDGYEYSHTSDRLWRKTRSNHGENQNEARSSGFLQYMTHYAKWLWGECQGVDPNRNFGFHWGEEAEGASSSDPCHETYAGPYAFSEPETKAIADYVMANRERIRMYLTLHSYSQMWLVPWGHTHSKPSDYSELANVARKAINAITKVHGTQYELGPAADMLYPTSGASDDWAKGEAGIKYSYTLELRDRETYGFLLPAAQIVPTAREIWAGIRTIARLVTCNS